MVRADRPTVMLACAAAVLLAGWIAIALMSVAMVALEGPAMTILYVPMFFSVVSTVMAARLGRLILTRRDGYHGDMLLVTALASSLLVFAVTWYQESNHADVWPLYAAGKIMHRVVPLLMLALWWTMPPRSHPAARIVSTPALSFVVYVAYVLALGSVTGHYPYPNIDPDEVGFVQVALIAGAGLASLIALSVLIHMADAYRRRSAKRRVRAHAG